MNSHHSMSQRTRRVITLLLLLGVASVGLAQTGGVYDLSWNTAAGGAIVEGGTFKLAQTLGQPCAGPQVAGDIFAHQPGFLQDSTYFSVPVRVSRFEAE